MSKGTGRNSFGSVFLRRGKWYLYFRANGKRVREVVKHAQSKTDALKVLSLKVNAALHAEYGLRQERKRIGFMEFADLFLERYAKPNKRSWRDDLYAVKILGRYFGQLFLHEVTAFDIESFKAARVKEVSKSRVNRNLDLVKKLFSLACDWQYLEESPARKVKKFRVFNMVERILDQGEQVRLLEASAPHLRPVLQALLNTGCRKSEILGLKWDQVDLCKGTVCIERTKSGRNRVIPINSVLLSVLESLQAVDGQSEYVFLGPDGKAMRDIKTSFKTACKRAGIEGMRIHDLRHTAASRMVEAGIDLPTVSRILGHSSITTTMRYAHSTQETMRKAVETLASVRDFVPTVSPKSKDAQTSDLHEPS
jgi:integrase